MPELPDSQQICAFHAEALTMPCWPRADYQVRCGVMRWIAANHRYNCLLWDQEDQARRSDVADSVIVAIKRAIDQYNQKRNDAIEAIDTALLEALPEPASQNDLWCNSETAGSIIDRLSILCLKIHHMGIQAERRDASAFHRQRCSARLELMLKQRRDLQHCLDGLLTGMREGRCLFRAYHHFKMYNDPTLNPWLKAPAEAGRANTGAASGDML